MSGFKLLAIRPLWDCDPWFLKNLRAGQLYKFYNNISFKNGDENFDLLTDSNFDSNVTEIHVKPNPLENLYSVISNEKNISVNISAIVGANGSGKSALTELLLYILFNVSNKLRYVKKENFIFNEFESIRFKEDLDRIKTGLKAELYYSINDSVEIIKIDGNNILACIKTEKNGITTIDRKSYNTITRRDQLADFFYTMIVNYSLYSFNTNEIGIWIKSIFHKNDGYQMPAVVNPFREEGKIDINIETFLTRSRFLANVISINEYKEIDTNLQVSKVSFYRDENKIERLFSLSNRNQERYSEQFIRKFRKRIIIPLYTKMYGSKGKNKVLESDYPVKGHDSVNIQNIVELYLINKLITIPSKYTNFEEFNFKLEKQDEIEDNFDLDNELIDDFIKRLYEDRSHVTVKVRQALNFLALNLFQVELYDGYFEVKLDEIETKVESIRQRKLFTDIIDYLPPPIFFSEIEFTNESLFKNLSSGQRQSIYSLNSIIYHLKNIDSVHKSSTSKKIKRYRSVNLILDEIELYFHPTFQKNYINNLLLLIKNCQLEYITNINILFLTHSPFILSDIIATNVLKLNDGSPEQWKENELTFGANISDLLSDSFFLSDGLIGQYAKNKIQDIIEYINYNAERSKKEWISEPLVAKKVIEQIGEPYLSEKLNDMFLEAFPEFKGEEIKKLEEKIKKLKDDTNTNK
ncbi:hypothetical protein [Flavobacterium sp.]|uniref:hypothetical protein n=1 Tax=Flavobacterium sp. TaxID=239 RepID=UPI00260D56DE|nr:hypothetical protein [Flavobacterium sp.]